MDSKVFVKREFRENGHRDIQTSLSDVNEFISLLSVILDQIWWNLIQETHTWHSSAATAAWHLVHGQVLNKGISKTIFDFEFWILCEIWSKLFKISDDSSAQCLWLVKLMGGEGRTFGRKWKNCSHTFYRETLWHFERKDRLCNVCFCRVAEPHLVQFYCMCVSRQKEFMSLSTVLVNNQPDAQLFFLYVYLNSLHVSSNPVLIIRRINCIDTTSGICHSV